MAMDVSRYKPMFVSESREHLQSMNKSLLELERNPENAGALNAMFRAAHSLKGIAATMGYDEISKLSHTMEGLMDRLRGEKRIDRAMIDVLFECLDMLNALIDDVATDKIVEHDLAPIYEKLGYAPPAGMEEVPKPVAPKEVEEKKPVEVAPTIRVDVGKIGALQDLVGELLIARMRAAQVASKYDIGELSEVMTNINRLTSDLQYTVLAMRMSPVDYLFGKFPRLVRDMSKKEGKDIDLAVEGKEIELDRLVMDEINDAMAHLLRNAVDHGIETPEQRARAGKRRKGTIKLIARREGDYVIIEVSDDGRGIDVEAIKKVAVQKGIITEGETSKLTAEGVFDLLGAPGLSTMKKITEVSGRGVGFDVVKTKIKSLGGTIKIQSEKNVGTKATMKLPLTTAIIQSLMVVVGGETYAVPLGSVREVVAIGEGDLKSVQQREIIEYRGKVVPILRLRNLLGVPIEQKIGPAVIVERQEEVVGLMVDSIAGQQETVIKPLSDVLKDRKEFAGATILPNGRVALILDIAGLVG